MRNLTIGNLTKIVITILILIFTTSLYGNKIPGSYSKYKESNSFIRELGLRVKPKNGFFEHYFMIVKKSKDVPREISINMIYSIFDDKETNSQWFEMTTNGGKWGKNSFKMLYSDGLMKGEIKRLMLLVKDHGAFEIPMSSNLKKELEEKTNEKIAFKFIKNSKVTIGSKSYDVKIYRNEEKGAEYALMDEKDSKLFGIAYAKTPKMEMYLKGLGENGVSVFPKKVPVLDMLNTLTGMNKAFLNKQKEKENAIEEEKRIENGNKIDDPVERLNKMLEEETKGQ